MFEPLDPAMPEVNILLTFQLHETINSVGVLFCFFFCQFGFGFLLATKIILIDFSFLLPLYLLPFLSLFFSPFIPPFLSLPLPPSYPPFLPSISNSCPHPSLNHHPSTHRQLRTALFTFLPNSPAPTTPSLRLPRFIPPQC